MATHRGSTFSYKAGPDLSEENRRRFHTLELDAQTRSFVDWALDSPQAKSVSQLRDVACETVDFYDANAIADAYHMRTLSTVQWAEILEPHLSTKKGERSLLDVGAGDGKVTAQVAPHFDQVLATETSGPMVARLREHGWEARHIDLATEPILDRSFDLVAVQNVVDRTARPKALLSALPPLVKPGGLICILVPLPIKPVVFEKGGTRKPEETIPTESTWGSSANRLIEWLSTLGLVTVCLSRAPYLCRGDVHKPLIALDDAVLLCRPASVPLVGL